jgi:hypothetical protein
MHLEHGSRYFGSGRKKQTALSLIATREVGWLKSCSPG